MKNEEQDVRIIAYDRFMEVVETYESYSRIEPSLQLLEFMMNTDSQYPGKIIRYEMIVAR